MADYELKTNMEGVSVVLAKCGFAIARQRMAEDGLMTHYRRNRGVPIEAEWPELVLCNKFDRGLFLIINGKSHDISARMGYGLKELIWEEAPVVKLAMLWEKTNNSPGNLNPRGTARLLTKASIMFTEIERVMKGMDNKDAHKISAILDTWPMQTEGWGNKC
jgi:hypothetical protein